MVTKRTLDLASSSTSKKQKTHISSDDAMLPSPLGLQWDENNYSCAYDAFFGILYHVWVLNPEKWTENFRQIDDQYLGLLASGFHQALREEISLELTRDKVRQVLHEEYPDMFPMGQIGTSVGDLAFKMLWPDNHIAQSQYRCPECGRTSASEWDNKFGSKLDADCDTPSSIMGWIAKLENVSNKKCPDCLHNMVKKVSYNVLPNILVLEYPELDIKTNHKIKLQSADGESKMLYLRGIVYHGQNHFVSRIITPEGNMWFHLFLFIFIFIFIFINLEGVY
jgi:predicted RNA-binding Zn-ribbon protein involved in translation (DUF1610 family)